MCDCVVVTPEASQSGAMLFGKNSDREADEAQLLEIVGAADHAPGARLSCTYIDIPQAPTTRRVLLSRPTWMWGAEIALNDAGLAIGNEAVFTRSAGGSFRQPPSGCGLTGMDIVRLVAERAGSADEGVDLIAELLAAFGQGGPGGYRDKRFVYHNSFLLADPQHAWVVETAGVMWVAKRVTGVRSISNALTIGDDYDRASPDLAARARDLGRHRGSGSVNFRQAFADRELGFAAAATERRSCLEGHVREAVPADVAALMEGLRLHTKEQGLFGRWTRGLRATVCAHASWLPTKTASQTTASMVARLSSELPVAFVTGTSLPCTSTFKPVWLDTGLVGYDKELWWEHYAELRAQVDRGNDGARLGASRASERIWCDQATALGRADHRRRAELTARAFARADAVHVASDAGLGQGPSQRAR